MRNSGKNKGLNAALFGATGWLFADLLLALAMLFLLAQPSTELAPGTARATPLPVCTPTVPPVPSLNPHDYQFELTINQAGVNNNISSAVDPAKQQVRDNLSAFLVQNNLSATESRAGLVILFGGAPSLSDNPSIADDKGFFNNVLLGLGAESDHFLFTGNVALKALTTFGKAPSYMKVDVYLFTAPAKPKSTNGCLLPTPLPTAAADVNRFA